MSKDYKRDENGTVIRSARNMSKMNIFEYSGRYLIRDYWDALRGAFFEAIPALLYFVVVILIVVTFPISMPLFAAMAIRRNKKFVALHSPKA